MAAPNRKGTLAKLGTPTPGSGKIGRRHRYEHEGLGETVADLQNQVAQLQTSLGAPGGGNVAGTTINTTTGGDHQGTDPTQTNQGDNQGPLTGPQGPPGPPGPSGGGGISWPIIAFWHSSNGPVPAGWSLCDGSNGTPDLISGNPLLQMSGTAGANNGAAYSFTVAGDTGDATLTTTCILQGTGAGISVLNGPVTHSHPVSIDVTFARNDLAGNLDKYKLLPIMWTG